MNSQQSSKKATPTPPNAPFPRFTGREIQPQRGVPSPGSFVSVFDALRRAKEGPHPVPLLGTTTVFGWLARAKIEAIIELENSSGVSQPPVIMRYYFGLMVRLLSKSLRFSLVDNPSELDASPLRVIIQGFFVNCLLERMVHCLNLLKLSPRQWKTSFFPLGIFVLGGEMRFFSRDSENRGVWKGLWLIFFRLAHITRAEIYLAAV